MARPQALCQSEPLHSQALEHPRVVHQQLGLGIDMMQNFAMRSSHYYQTLANIARYLPKEGEQCREALKLVTLQRCWTYDVECGFAFLVGTCYQLESNTLKELATMWQTGQQKLPVALVKANFRATLKNLESLGAHRELVKQEIEKLKGMATQMVNWQGQEEKMHVAVNNIVEKFGGSAQCEAYIKELQDKQEALTKARDEERIAEKKLSEIAGRQDELQCQLTVHEVIANNSSGTLQDLQDRAKKLDDEAIKRSEEAAATLNIAHKKRKLICGFSLWYTDRVDNRGDCAKWRAERFKDIARNARKEEGDQATRAKKANKELADIKGKLTVVRKEIEDYWTVLGAAVQTRMAAERTLKETQEKAKALRHEHGGLNLSQIAALRDHMQKFPTLLGAAGQQDQNMFAAISGEMQYHQNLCERLSEFLKEDDDVSCQHMMLFLRPQIARAIENSKFFSEELGPLKNKIDKQIEEMASQAIEETSIPTPGRAQAGALPTPQQPLLASLSEQDEEPLF